MQLTILDPDDPEQDFPDIESALEEPEGLLAAGGCLSQERLINAYKLGIFPWFNPNEPILWWSPNPRLVLFPEHLKISRSLRKTLRKDIFSITYDQAFANVMQLCAAPRNTKDSENSGTWISEDMYQAYNKLYQLGYAHSIEVWFEEELVGGLYGVAIGQVFYGESMFHKKTDASKVAFCHLVHQLSDWGYQLIDCQVHTNHLSSLGAEEIDRSHFCQLLKQYVTRKPSALAWANI